MGCRAEFAKELESAHARHIQIKRDEVRSAIADEDPSRWNVGRYPDDLAIRISISDLLHQCPDGRRVVDDEKTYHVHGGRAFASARTAQNQYRVIYRAANGLNRLSSRRER